MNGSTAPCSSRARTVGRPADAWAPAPVTAKPASSSAPSAKAAAVVADAVLHKGMPKFTLLNINTPYGPNKGFKVTVQAKRNHVTVVSKRMDPRHRAYYWIEEGNNHWEPHDRSDYQAVRDGYISITPLQPDMTAHDAMQYVEALPLTDEPVRS